MCFMHCQSPKNPVCMQQSPNRLNYKHWLYDFSVTNSITDNNLKTQIEVTGKRSCISKQETHQKESENRYMQFNRESFKKCQAN